MAWGSTNEHWPLGASQEIDKKVCVIIQGTLSKGLSDGSWNTCWERDRKAKVLR